MIGLHTCVHTHMHTNMCVNPHGYTHTHMHAYTPPPHTHLHTHAQTSQVEQKCLLQKLQSHQLKNILYIIFSPQGRKTPTVELMTYVWLVLHTPLPPSRPQVISGSSYVSSYSLFVCINRIIKIY